LESLNCPKCHSDDMHHSHIRNSLESFLNIMGIEPYRCYSCNFRTYVMEKGKRNDSFSFMTFSDKIVKLLWYCFLIMIAVFIGIIVVTRIG